MYDIIIIGGGPAAMTAAIYAARKELAPLMIAPELGGQAMWAGAIQNYLGYRVISGYDLVQKFEEHVRDFNVPIAMESVTGVTKTGDVFTVRTETGKEYEGHAVLVATGRSVRDLGVPGEDKYKGKGIAYCATCDAPLFAGEKVGVAGGGNAGLEAAVQLIKIAEIVYIIEGLPTLTGDAVLQEHIRAAKNAQVFTRTAITRVDGNGFMTGIGIKNLDTGDESELPATGLFVEIGSRPNVGFLPPDVNLNEYNEVIIDCANRTNIPGLYAAGDVTNVAAKQIIIAAGEGGKALLDAYKYLIHNFPAHG